MLMFIALSDVHVHVILTSCILCIIIAYNYLYIHVQYINVHATPFIIYIFGMFLSLVCFSLV
jgi:hypothetical protein